MDRRATDEELSQQLPALRRFALSLTRERTSADDLVQGTLEVALTRDASRTGEGSLRAWLFSILYRRFLDGERRKKRYGRFLAALRLHVEGVASGSPELLLGAQAELIAFGHLPTEQRAVLLVVAVEGLSYQEAAAALGIPIGTVMSRLSRGRAALLKLAEGEPARPLRLVRR
jgi:RNA polymerase sigma-70 factor, ECF subfamily